MTKHENFKINFQLKGFTSILIGAYFLLAAYTIKTMVDGFLIDDNPAGMLSVQLIEGISISIIILVFLLSTLALFFKGKKLAKRNQYHLWNDKTKRMVWFYFLGFITLFFVLFTLLKLGKINFLTPIFLALYALLLFILRGKSKAILVICLASVLLAIICVIIPSYWYSSLFILGIAHITYGVVVK